MALGRVAQNHPAAGPSPSPAAQQEQKQRRPASMDHSAAPAGGSRLLSLPEDVLVGRICPLLPARSLLSLFLTCTRLRSLLVHSPALWLPLCLALPSPAPPLPADLLRLWLPHLPSPLHLYRFLLAAIPLLGLWSHRNPELGNLVAVVPSILSIVALRLLPQPLSSRPLLSPVFELLPDPLSPRPLLLLHSGRGSIHAASLLPCPSPSILLLEPSPPSPAFATLSLHRRRLLLRTISDALVFPEPPDPPPLLLLDDLSNAPALTRRWRALLRLARPLLPGVRIRRGPSSLRAFLRSPSALGLCVRAAAEPPPPRALLWPDAGEARHALYRLDVEPPREGRELAGVWGGAFGWPPARPGDDLPGKALFLLLLRYAELDGRLRLVATKILEGTQHVLHPNGSTMFVADADGDDTGASFPWAADGEGRKVEVERTMEGRGIAGGNGFRCPASRPGTLFVIRGGRLAFLWDGGSRSVLIVERVDLTEMLRHGERVPALPPVANFAYLTESFSNVFMAYANGTELPELEL